jgi:ABC-2 type transport system permease protein
LLLFGYALSAKVKNLDLGVVDYSRTPESRELLARMTESESFRLAGSYLSTCDLGDAINRNDLDAGLVIPYHFVRDLQRGRGATVQVLFNATNTNNSAIGQGYIKAIILEYNRTITAEGLHADFRRIAAGRLSARPCVVAARPSLQPRSGRLVVRGGRRLRPAVDP